MGDAPQPPGRTLPRGEITFDAQGDAGRFGTPRETDMSVRRWRLPCIPPMAGVYNIHV
jgi:hypothetical protein